jgi:probable rRNA maturation factor
MIKGFNTEKLSKISKDIALNDFLSFLEDELSIKKDTNIIFVNEKQIEKLNREYREKDEVTDVLSFNIDSQQILGEIYICPEYVINKISKKEDMKEEIYRLIVHGLLHLQGYDHKRHFDKVDYKNEPMYIKQEEIINKFLK